MKMLGSAAAATLLVMAAAPAAAQFGQGIVYVETGRGRPLNADTYGYFRQQGDLPAARNGHVRYDYDRGYPYDHYSRAAPAELDEEPYEYAARVRQCTMEATRDRRTGAPVEVRICRN